MSMLLRLLPLLLAGMLSAQENPDWRKPFPPFRIVGNVYWVGTYDLSTYLITTPQGHILINSGMADPAVADEEPRNEVSDRSARGKLRA